MTLLQELKKNPFVLAPMAAITDCAFRSFMREMGCGIVISELVSATGLRYSSEKTKKIMSFTRDQHPVGIQLFGERLEDLDYAARCVEQSGADFVDLNFGCPVPKVVKRGAGAALLKDLVALGQVLRTVKSAVKIPVTIKTRTGWDEGSRNATALAHVAHEEGMEWMAIHGRTRAAGYTGRADWDYIAEVKRQSPLPILGNGDIGNATQANSRLSENGLDGVMIGRGCLKNPWIFSEALEIFRLLSGGSNEMGQQPHSPDRDFPQMISRLLHHLELHNDDRLVQLQLKKLAAWFSAGYPGSATFRKEIFAITDKSRLLEGVEAFYASVARLQQQDTSHEAFLMGGHG